MNRSQNALITLKLHHPSLSPFDTEHPHTLNAFPNVLFLFNQEVNVESEFLNYFKKCISFVHAEFDGARWRCIGYLWLRI